MEATLLWIDPDSRSAEFMQVALRKDGYDVESVTSGKFLVEEGVPEDRFLVVFNRPLGAEPMVGNDLETQLGRPIDLAIPNSGYHVGLANSLHAPRALRFPEESASRALREPSEKVAEKLQVPAG